MRKLVTYFIEECVSDPKDEMAWGIITPTAITWKYRWSNYREACEVLRSCRDLCKDKGEDFHYRLVKSVEVRRVLKV